jgi:hypothetical protein
MPRRRLKRIHVNQHVIRRNAKQGEREPPIRIKVGRDNIPAHRVVIQGESELVYWPENPLSCGARLWIETHSPLVVETDSERRAVV